jgi:hypothetical protein
MTKSIVAALAALAVAATAVHADTYYKGLIRYVAVSEGCGPEGPRAGDTVDATYHPYSAKEPYSALNLFGHFAADSKELALPFDATLRNLTRAVAVYDTSGDVTGNPNLIVKVSVTNPVPSNPSPAPSTITLEGQIQNPFADVSMNACIADYKFTGFKS